MHPADVQDRDGAFDLLRQTRRRFPFVERIFADGGYKGREWPGQSRAPEPGASRS